MEKEAAIKEIRKGLHDINNKLTAVTAYCSSLLRSDKLDTETKQYLRSSVDNAMQAGDIIISISRILKEL